jgi:hypothetical protein
LVVLDAGQFSICCRRCGWRSGPSSVLTEAQAAFQSHACLDRRNLVDRRTRRGAGAETVASIDARGWTDEARVVAAMEVRSTSW